MEKSKRTLKKLYPNNILAELLNIEVSSLDLETMPEDIEERLNLLYKNCLKEREIAIVYQRFHEGKTLQEMVDPINLSKERIRVLLHRLIRKLRSFLEKIDFFANNVNEIGFEKATEVKYPKAEGSAIKQSGQNRKKSYLFGNIAQDCQSRK